MALLGVVVAMLLQCMAAQTVHVVGDSIGWTIPQDGAQAYEIWAASNQFVVGDILSTIFYSFSHSLSFCCIFSLTHTTSHLPHRDIYFSNNITFFNLRFVLSGSNTIRYCCKLPTMLHTLFAIFIVQMQTNKKKFLKINVIRDP